MSPDMTTLPAATATATAIIELENLTHMTVSFCSGVTCCSGIPRETEQADGRIFQYSPIARKCLPVAPARKTERQGDPSWTLHATRRKHHNLDDPEWTAL